jgi:MFS family permease
MGSSINIALPSIGKDFEMDAVLLSWGAIAYLIAAAMFLVPFERIADIYGRKKVFTGGILLYTLSPLLSAFSTSALMLISFRVFQGFGAAMILGTGVAIVTSVFPMGERGKALGINVAAVYLGLTLGPSIGGFLTQHFGWGSVFIVNVPLCLIVLAIVLWKLKGDWATAKGEKFDIPGSIIYSIMLVAVMYGFSLLPAMSGAWLILGGVLAFLSFVKWEMRVKSPVLNISLFRNNKVFAFSNLAALLHYSAVFATFFLLKPLPTVHKGAYSSKCRLDFSLPTHCAGRFLSHLWLAFR